MIKLQTEMYKQKRFSIKKYFKNSRALTSRKQKLLIYIYIYHELSSE